MAHPNAPSPSLSGCWCCAEAVGKVQRCCYSSILKAWRIYIICTEDFFAENNYSFILIYILSVSEGFC